MKIDSTTTASSPVSSETRSRSNVSQPLAGAAAEVHLSELAAHLRATGDAPAFDATRVAEIKQAISEGRFSINPEAITDRLIAAASDLLAAQRKD